MALKSKPVEQVRADVPVIQGDIVRVNINLPASVRKAWKQAALDNDTDVTTLIVDAMTKHLASLKLKK